MRVLIILKQTLFTGETREVGNMGGFGDKLMRHIVLGAELRPFKAFAVRVGYNYPP